MTKLGLIKLLERVPDDFKLHILVNEGDIDPVITATANVNEIGEPEFVICFTFK